MGTHLLFAVQQLRWKKGTDLFFSRSGGRAWTTAIAVEDALTDPLFDFQNGALAAGQIENAKRGQTICSSSEALSAGQFVAPHRSADERQLGVRQATLDPAAIARLP